MPDRLRSGFGPLLPGEGGVMRRGRNWSRTLRHSTLPFAVAVLMSASPILATAAASTVNASAARVTYMVTTIADTNDGRCDAQCSVREAILAANAHPGADTVRIPAGIYKLSIPGVNEDAGATGDLDITGPVDLVGVGEGHTVLDGARID